MSLMITEVMKNQNRFTKYDVGVQRDRKIIMTLPIIYTITNYVLEKLPEPFGIISEDYLMLSTLTLTIIIFLFGIFIVKKKYELSINEAYIEYAIKGNQDGKGIKMDAEDLVNPIGVVYFRDIKGIDLNKEQNIICIFLKYNNNVFYQWHKVEKDQLEEIYINLTSKLEQLV